MQYPKYPTWICVWTLAAAAACGSTSSNLDAGGPDTPMPPPPGEFSLAVDPGTLTLPITGTGTAAVNVTRGDAFTDTVELSASGAPAGVTVAFEAASLPDGTSTTNMTITVDDTATPGTTDITVTGTAGSLTRDATLSLTLALSTVSGTVRNSGMNVVVRIVGKDAVTTGAGGTFTFTDVVLPYDIYVIGTEGIVGFSSIPAVNYYQGLTRTDPVLTRPSQGSGLIFTLTSTGFIAGTRTGGSNSVPTMLFWGTHDSDVATLAAPNTVYTGIKAVWLNNPTTTGTFYGIQVERGTANAPTAYPGYGKVPNKTLNENVSNVVDISLEAITSAPLTGTITQPTGFPAPSLTMTQLFGNRAVELWTATTSNATSAIPLIPDGTTAFHAESASGGTTTQVVFPALAAATDVTFALPAPAGLTGPVNNATNVTTATPFAFTTAADHVYKVSMTSGAANFHVFTTSSSTTIPDVDELPLPSATAFKWTVTGFGPATSVDRAADMEPLEFALKADFTGDMHFHTTSVERSFNTQ